MKSTHVNEQSNFPCYPNDQYFIRLRKRGVWKAKWYPVRGEGVGHGQEHNDRASRGHGPHPVSLKDIHWEPVTLLDTRNTHT